MLSGRHYDFTDNINNFWANVNYKHGKNKIPEVSQNEESEFGRKLKEQMAQNGIQYSFSENGTASKYSLTSWNNTDKTKVEDSLVGAGFTKEVAKKWIEDVNGIASIIAADRTRLDYEAASNQNMLKKNQEYVRTLDSSTLW